MTSKRQREVYSQFRTLNNQGISIPNTDEVLCRSNGGEESEYHVAAKAVAAKVLKDEGYRTHSEVEIGSTGECDVIGYGHEGRKPIVIELENDLTESVRKKKVNQYVRGNIRECWVIDLGEAPNSPSDLYDYIADQVGLDP